jgi:putative spermidine/putrescine transport system ATP-binding protein/spermidine/putrescine transport system ATP-binding protein
VADFLGHSNFIAGVILGRENGMMKVRTDTDDVIWSDHKGDWSEGDRVEIVVRAQRFEAYRKQEFEPRAGMNHFSGRIKDRSYMGGEVSYFVEMENRNEIHVISMMRTRIYDLGDEVCVQFSPHHCHLISEER